MEEPHLQKARRAVTNDFYTYFHKDAGSSFNYQKLSLRKSTFAKKKTTVASKNP